MSSMRGEAKESYHGKLGRMGLKISTASLGEEVGLGHTGPKDDGTQGVRPAGYATGYETPEANERTMSEKSGKSRLDRPGFKKGGRVKHKGTTVNVIVAPSKPAMPPMMPPPGAGPAGPPPMPPPGMGAGPGPGTPPGPPMGGAPGPMPRKKGGAVRSLADCDDDMVKDDDHDADDKKGRKNGGPVKHDFDAGARSGVGRLEKIGKKP